MIEPIANHLLQSTVFAAVAGILTIFLRHNQARTRYWLWLAASLKFLVPFWLFVDIGHRLSWSSAPAITQPGLAVVMDEISQPFVAADVSSPMAIAPSIWPSLLLVAWICGFVAVLALWCVRWWRVAAIVRAARPLREGFALISLRRLEQIAGVARPIELRSSASRMEPGVFGIFRQVLLLPENIATHLDETQLDAIFAHELCHVRRRDNLAAAVHMLVEAIFWFHPLVWWIGSRLIEERERACDEEVVRLGSDPEIYAETILKICKVYLESPLACAAGISGADLRKRIESIMENPFLKSLSLGKKLVLGAIGVLALVTPITIGILSAPAGNAQAQAPVAVSSPLQLPAQSVPASASSPSAASPTFEAADVQATGGVQNGRSGFYAGGRYELRNATMLDLITNAYSLEGMRVMGGPAWMEADRFDIIAKAPPASTPEALKAMLRAVLADRFKLVAHSDTKSLQAYVLTAGKRPLMKPSDGSGASGCDMQPLESTIMNAFLVCHNMTMAAFADILRTEPHPQVRSFVGSNLVADLTGLKGSWDFSIKWSGRGMLATVGSEGVSLFEALDKELGLKLELQKASFPVVVVDSVNQKPTDNPAGVTQALPSASAAPTDFEVADIKLSTQDKPTAPQFKPGGRMDVRGITLMALIQHAWSLDNIDGMIVGGPKFLDSERFDIIAKATMPDGPSGMLQDDDALRLMLRALLIDRFKLTTHTEEQPTSVYALVAANPKLKKTDPSSRSGCRNAGAASVSVMVRTFTCDNMTMAQFATRLRGLASTYTNHPIVDATGMDGSWDFTFSFSLATQLQASIGRGDGQGAGAPAAQDPNGTVSLFDALEKQLGLKLEQQKRAMPVLVIDHVEQMPTDN